MEQTTLLLIDDETRLRQVIARVLELEIYTVLQAKNAREGWELLLNHPEITVVLSDVKLPDDNGLNLLQKIKNKFPQQQTVCSRKLQRISERPAGIGNFRV